MVIPKMTSSHWEMSAAQACLCSLKKAHSFEGDGISTF